MTMNFLSNLALLALLAGALGTTIAADGYIAPAVALDVNGVMAANPQLKTCKAACDAVKIGCAADFAGSYIAAWALEADPVC